MRQPSPLFNANMRATDGVIPLPLIYPTRGREKKWIQKPKSVFFSLSQEVNWQQSVTYNSLTDIYKVYVSCPDLYFTENDDGEVDNALT